MDGCGEESPKEALFPNRLLQSPKNIRVEHGYDAEVTEITVRNGIRQFYLLRWRVHLQWYNGRTQSWTSLRVLPLNSTPGSQILTLTLRRVQQGEGEDKQKTQVLFHRDTIAHSYSGAIKHKRAICRTILILTLIQV